MTLTPNNAKLTKYAAMAWAANLQYFIVTIIVASAWKPAFDWKNNYTSDLGNTACGSFENHIVCSPLHGLMNLSFALQGALLIIGGILFIIAFKKRYRMFRAAMYMAIISGLGAIVVAVVPENTDLELHNLGAFITFLFGIITLILMSLSNVLPKILRLSLLALGVVSVMALVLFENTMYLGLGLGGMERIMDYSQISGIIAVGSYLLIRSSRNQPIPGNSQN